MNGNGKEVKAKILIQIALLEDGNVHYQSTSKNHLTCIGLIRKAESLILNFKPDEKKEESRIYRV